MQVEKLFHRHYPLPAHVPVLLESCLKYIPKYKGKKIYCDATFGNGGYTKALLDTEDCIVIALDQDPLAIERAYSLYHSHPEYNGRFFPILGQFGDMYHLVTNHFKTTQPILDAVLFDIGLSSNQIEDANRGFSFRKRGPLDMRMSSSGNLGKVSHLSNTITAETIVNNYSTTRMAEIILQYGEERQAKKIAKAIETARCKAPILYTSDLADIVANAVGYQGLGKSHPATKTFQAFRIYINDELEQLKKGFICAEHLLKPHGVCMAVTFHSLEDRLTKKFFHNCVQGNSNEQEQSIKEQIQPRPGYYRYLRRVAHEKEIERERTESIH